MTMVGEVGCPACKRTVPFKNQASGLASVSCQWCGLQVYARGEEADGLMRKWITKKSGDPPPTEDDKDEKKKKTKAAPPPAPAVKDDDSFLSL